jgi:hypothetical protein
MHEGGWWHALRVFAMGHSGSCFGILGGEMDRRRIKSTLKILQIQSINAGSVLKTLGGVTVNQQHNHSLENARYWEKLDGE